MAAATQLHLVAVRTNNGARHVVRSMLSHVANLPIVGDVRYGSGSSGRGGTVPNSAFVQLPSPLADKSVALHARCIYMPTVKLGDEAFTNILSTEPFVAPIPNTWKDFFDLTEEDVCHFNLPNVDEKEEN
mmetsp:Transcript_19530/g.28388  ORF Transcript_19530/g.28388 Transcript_19530/m.28388 type:complete len:130 (-) Transcript_19530:124-513(-)